MSLERDLLVDILALEVIAEGIGRLVARMDGERVPARAALPAPTPPRPHPTVAMLEPRPCRTCGAQFEAPQRSAKSLCASCLRALRRAAAARARAGVGSGPDGTASGNAFTDGDAA